MASNDLDLETIATHSGVFHADDAVGVAILMFLYHAELIRTRNPEEIEKADAVVDVGKTHEPENDRFDHHQRDFEQSREDGSDFASAGLVWLEYGENAVSAVIEGEGLPEPTDDELEEIAERVDSEFISGIDSGDTYGDAYRSCPDELVNLTDIIGSLNPTPIANPEPSDYDDAFGEAVELAQTVLKRQVISAYKDVVGSKIALERSTSHLDGRVLELPFSNGVDTLEMIREENPETAFAIFPDPSSGEWRIQQLPDVDDGSAPHLCQVADVDGDEIPGFVFRHGAGFIGGAQQREGVLRMAEISLHEAGLLDE